MTLENLRFEENLALRLVCRRLNWVVLRNPQFFNNGRYVNGVTHCRADKQKKEMDSETQIGEERESRGRFRLNALLFLNVLLGAAQLGVALPNLREACDKPLGTILVICGVVNFIQVFSFILWTCPEEVLHPLDEYDDEEFGWPLYIIGLLVWLSFITDFTLWIVMQLLYFGTLNTCDDSIKLITLISIVFRWLMLILYVCISINHLKEKIYQENKRKFGRNPYKHYRSRGGIFTTMFGQGGAVEDPDDAPSDDADREKVTIDLAQMDTPGSGFRSDGDTSGSKIHHF